MPSAEARRFDSIAIGDASSFEVVVTTEMVDDFAKLSGDFNPLHVDDSFAEATPFKQRIAHGMFLGALFSRMLGMHVPGLYCVYLSQTLKFKNPVFIGTNVHISANVAAKSDAARTLTISLTAADASSGTVYAEGEAVVRVTE